MLQKERKKVLPNVGVKFGKLKIKIKQITGLRNGHLALINKNIKKRKVYK
jgi:hypothetical protein